MAAPPSTPDRAIALVADLGEAAGRAHTEATLVPAAASALSRHLPLLWFELGRCERAGGAAEASIHAP